MFYRVFAIVAVLAFAGLFACAPSKPQASPEAAAAPLLTGGEWVVEDIGGKGIIDASRVTLNFGEDGRLAGRASCNRYNAGYTLEDGLRLVGAVAATRMACAPALMDQEGRFLRLLGEIEKFHFDVTGALILTTASGQTLLARRP